MADSEKTQGAVVKVTVAKNIALKCQICEHEEFDELFRKVRVTASGPERDAMVARMVEIYREEAVWLFSYYPKDIYLSNAWTTNTKRHGISKATLKYINIDDELRRQKRAEWNKPVTWPLLVTAIVLISLVLPGVIAYRRRQNATARSTDSQ